MQNSSSDFALNKLYFVTSPVLEWVPIFTSKPYFDLLIKAFNYCVDHKQLSIYAWVILDDHFHLLCHALEMSKTMQSLKRHAARQIINQLQIENKKWILNLFSYYKKRHKTQSDYQVWQEGFKPKLIVDEVFLCRVLKHMHWNPVEKGFVSKPEQWRPSSAACLTYGSPSLVRMTPFPFHVKPGFTR